MGEDRRIEGGAVPRAAEPTQAPGAPPAGNDVIRDDADPGTVPSAGRGEKPVRIALLGPLTVSVQGAAAAVAGRTQHRLIAALALAAVNGTRMEIGALVEAVYGADRPPRPRRSLATLVWRLRREWGARSIESDRYRYWLSPAHIAIDIDEFETAVSRGRAAMLARIGTGEPDDPRPAQDARAVTELRRALSLWRTGNPAEISVPEPERARLHELRLGATEQLAGLLASLGRHHEAIELLTPVVAAHPDWEHSAALLIDSLGAAGDGSGAQRTFDSARRTLLSLGVEPGPELTAAGARASGSGRVAAERETGSNTTAPVRAGRASHQTVTAGSDRGNEPDGGAAALIGRRRERDLLVGSMLVALDSRRPAAILVSGEAGIGKSTLLQAALLDVRAHRPARVVTVHCDRRSTLPFGPLQSLAGAAPNAALARLFDTSGGSGHLEDAREVHGALLRDIVRLAQPDGLILAVEDAQFAPRDTTIALARTLERCGAIPLVVVATTRDPQGTTGDEIARAAEDPAGFAALADRHIPLTGLDLREVAHMAQVDPGSGWAAQLHRLTGGNPLYVRQLQHIRIANTAGTPGKDGAAVAGATASRAGHLPADLTAAIDAHLAQVPVATLGALATAAAIGDQFGLMTLAALGGELRRSLTEWQDHVTVAIRHGLVRPDGDDDGRYRFTHALIAAHLYGQLSPRDSAVTHAAIAAALQRISITHPCPPDLLAHHFARGWPQTSTSDVVAAQVRAAGAVGAQLDFARAADYYRSALDYLAMDPDAAHAQQTADILGAAAGASAASGDIDAAAGLYASQERIAADAGLTRSRIFAALGALRIAFLRRSHPSVADPLAGALAASVRDDDLAGYLDLAGDGLAAVSVYRPARARELLADFASRGQTVSTSLRLAIWEHLSVPDQLASARELAGGTPARATTLARALHPVDAAARAASSEAVDPGGVLRTVDVAHRPSGRQSAHRVAAWLRLWVSEVAAGLRRFDEPPPRASHLADADDQTVFDLAQWRITREITAGRLPRARTLIKEALAAPQHADPAERARRAVSFYGQSLFLAMLAGDERNVADSPVATNPTWMTRHPVMRYIRAFLVTRGGPELRARGMVDEIIDELADGDIPDSDIAPRLIVATETCRLLDHRRGLQVCVSGLGRHRGEHGIFRFGQYWGSVDQSLADAHLALGRLDAAAEVYRVAIAGLRQVGAAVHLPTAQRALAVTLERQGSRGDDDEIRALRAEADAADRAMGLTHRIAATDRPADAR